MKTKTYLRIKVNQPKFRWWLRIPFALLYLLQLNAAAQTYVGISLNAGNRQYYAPSSGFENALAPSGSITISRNDVIHENWFFRYGAAAGIVGYKLNVVMIDTLGPNGDVSPFPEYSTFFASAEFLFGHRISVFRRQLSFGAGIGITAYLGTASASSYSVEVVMPNNELVSLFEARMRSPASDYSLLWKAGGYYDLSTVFSVGVEYIYHLDPASEGTYDFYHTPTPRSGVIWIYQREFRLGFFYNLGGRR